MSCGSVHDVRKRIAALTKHLDVSGTGTVSFHEVSKGLSKMDFQPAIKGSKQEFQEMSAGLLADNGEIDGEHMEAMLMAELAAYAERMLALDIVGVPVRDEHLAAIMFAVCTLLRHQPLSAQAYL